MHTTRKPALEAGPVLLVGTGLAVLAGVAGATTPATPQHASPPVGDASDPTCLSVDRPNGDLKIQVGNFSPPIDC